MEFQKLNKIKTCTPKPAPSAICMSKFKSKTIHNVRIRFRIFFLSLHKIYGGRKKERSETQTDITIGYPLMPFFTISSYDTERPPRDHRNLISGICCTKFRNNTYPKYTSQINIYQVMSSP